MREQSQFLDLRNFNNACNKCVCNSSSHEQLDLLLDSTHLLSVEYVLAFSFKRARTDAL